MSSDPVRKHFAHMETHHCGDRLKNSTCLGRMVLEQGGTSIVPRLGLSVFVVSGPNKVVFHGVPRTYIYPDSNKTKNVKRRVYQAYNEARKIVVMLVGSSMNARNNDKSKYLVLQRFTPTGHLFNRTVVSYQFVNINSDLYVYTNISVVVLHFSHQI